MAEVPIVPPTLNVELDHELQQEVNFFLKWGELQLKINYKNL